MKKIIFGIACVFLSASSLAFATDGNKKTFADQVFKELDMNKDGVIDKNDIQKFSKKEFDLIDKNKDNKISKNEFFNFVCNKSCNQGNCECKSYKNKEDLSYLKEYWTKVDRNSYGYVTREEKLEADLNSFHGLDNDGDGKIKKEDIEAQLY